MLEWPEDSLQSLLNGPWWVKVNPLQAKVDQGTLLLAFVHYPENKPHRLIALGRTEDGRHDKVDYQIEEYDVQKLYPASRLPVAALPKTPQEEYFVYRGKIRPVLVVGPVHKRPSREIRAGSSRWKTDPTLLVAPYFGTDPKPEREGWPAEFVDRIRRCLYPQYMWDNLPVPGSEKQGSVLRMDQILPIPHKTEAYRHSGWELSKNALAVVQEWLQWSMLNRYPRDGYLDLVRSQFWGHLSDSAAAAEEEPGA